MNNKKGLRFSDEEREKKLVEYGLDKIVINPDYEKFMSNPLYIEKVFEEFIIEHEENLLKEKEVINEREKS